MADNSIIELLKHYISKLKSFFFSKDALSFLLFLALASAFWFVNALDKERETEITIPVRFSGLPQNIAIVQSTTSNITIKVKDKGLNLFAYTSQGFNAISFDLSRTFYEKGNIFISSDQIRSKLSRLLLPTTSIMEIKPASISMHYEKLSVRTLPIEFDAKIELDHQYVLSDKVQISPSEITVFGPKRILNAMKSVKTEPVELLKLNDTTHLDCKLMPVKFVKFAANEVKVSLFVEMFTEKNIQLPVEVVNCPANIVIRTFPANVNLIFNVGMSHFNSLKDNDLSVNVDYNDIKNNAKLKQKLNIVNTASYISNVRVMPQEVEYIIEMK